MPNPLQPEEVRRIVGRITQNESTERMETIFRNGDLVKIIDGPFNNFSGTVQEVNEEKMKMKVMVSIFGGKTPVEIDCAVGRRGVGDIILERKRGIGVAAGHPLSNQLVEILNVAGLNAHLYPSATNMKWSKLLTNLLANATSAILDMSPAEIFSDPDLCHLEINQLREVIRVMAAQGIDTIDLPGTPVKALAFAVRWLPIAWTRPILIKAVGSGRGGKMPSFHVDLRSGRGQTEVDYLNGAVVRFGDRLDIPIPVNRLLNETLLDLSPTP